jgi:hypothetical protein
MDADGPERQGGIETEMEFGLKEKRTKEKRLK